MSARQQQHRKVGKVGKLKICSSERHKTQLPGQLHETVALSKCLNLLERTASGVFHRAAESRAPITTGNSKVWTAVSLVAEYRKNSVCVPVPPTFRGKIQFQHSLRRGLCVGVESCLFECQADKGRGCQLAKRGATVLTHFVFRRMI